MKPITRTLSEYITFGDAFDIIKHDTDQSLITCFCLEVR